MTKILFAVLLSIAFWCAPALRAENYPYRSDVLWVTVPDHADWVYRTGEKAKVEVQFYKYGIPRDGVVVEYELGGDLMPADKTGTVTLKNGRATIDMGTMKTPGFRDCCLTAKVDGVTYRHHVKVGFSPEKIEPYTQLPADFREFWQQALDEAERCPMVHSLTPAPEYANDKVDCYLLKLQCVRPGNYVYGYLFIPKAEGKYPVVLCPPGAGIKPIKDPTRHRYYAEEGCIRLEIEIHGIRPDLGADAYKEVSNAFGSRNNSYLCNGLDDRDSYYMKRVYLACSRCIDFLTSLPQWDGKNAVLQGGSQGGALAIVTAALNKKVTACVANHPALSDMAGYRAGRTGGYPHFKTKFTGMDTPEKEKTMAYYDVVNFARLLTVPTYMTWGYNDNTCPPTTSYAVYNVITAPKEALVTPINEHWTSDATERGHLDWIKKHLK